MNEFKLSEIPTAMDCYSKDRNSCLKLIVLLFGSNKGVFTETTIANNVPYIKTVKSEKYLFTDIAGIRILMTVDKVKAFYEMVDAGVPVEILSKYAYENLLVTIN